MLLQRLTEYERPAVPGVDALPPFYQVRPMRWALVIDTDGRLASPELLDLSDPTDPKTRHGTPTPVPHLTRSSGISPLLGADDIQYVLGWADESSKPARVADCHSGFVDLINRWSAAWPTDPTAQAVARFFNRKEYELVCKPPEWSSKQGVLLLVGEDGRPMPDERSVRSFWAIEVERRKSGAGTAGGRRGICLVCGQDGTLVDRLPQQLPRRLVPQAGQASAALVSANKRIHTYDFSDSLTTVPICIGCAQHSVANLRHLLDDPDHALGGSDSRMTWWTLGRQFAMTSLLTGAHPADVRDLIARVHQGAGIGSELKTGRFCSATISGSGARVVVRDWVDMPLPQLESHIAAWFKDHQILGVDRTRDGYLPLTRLELATGRWIARRSEDGRTGEYARFDDRTAQRPVDVRRLLLQTAIKGLPLPPPLFGHLLTRIRTDGRIDDPRAALLRLTLVRRARLPNSTGKGNPVPLPGLDPDNRDPAYLAGRIFAQLEYIQYQAARIGRSKEERLNATFADRHLAGAIANPKIALVQGQKLAQPWLKKIGRGRPDTAFVLGSQLSDLFALMESTPGLPGRARLDEQAMFILGYHHHRSESIRRGREANAAKVESPGGGVTSPAT